MRKILFALLFAAAAARAASITGTLQYNFTSTVACSSTVTANCAVSFEVGWMNGAVFVPIGSVPLPAAPAGAMTVTIPAVAFNGVFGAAIQLAAGVNALDWQGHALAPLTFFLAPGTSAAGPAPVTGFAPSVGP